MTHFRGRKTIFTQCVAAAILALVLFPSQAQVTDGNADEIRKPVIELGPGSAHPGTTGEVRLELEDIFLDGDPHAYGFVWDIAIDEKKGEVYVMC
ncbi:MAG: hypothetical protein GY903_03155, partial [Fuerstiella sp.]|nr:hypothetical protein [Fuerstiella sp.]